LDFDSQDIAEQLTITSWKLFSSITCSDMMTFAKGGSKKNTARLVQCISGFNVFSNWICSEITNVHELKPRAKLIDKLLDICKYLLQIGNFNDLYCIAAALNNHSIARLKLTWQAVSSKSKEYFTVLNNLFTTHHNYSSTRERVHQFEKDLLPCIPYLSLYLIDLTFLYEGNKNYIDTASLQFNMFKLKKIAEVMFNVRRFQERKFNLVENPKILTFIEAIYNSYVVIPEGDLRGKSLFLEPMKK